MPVIDFRRASLNVLHNNILRLEAKKSDDGIILLNFTFSKTTPNDPLNSCRCILWTKNGLTKNHVAGTLHRLDSTAQDKETQRQYRFEPKSGAFDYVLSQTENGSNILSVDILTRPLVNFTVPNDAFCDKIAFGF